MICRFDKPIERQEYLNTRSYLPIQKAILNSDKAEMDALRKQTEKISVEKNEKEIQFNEEKQKLQAEMEKWKGIFDSPDLIISYIIIYILMVY